MASLLAPNYLIRRPIEEALRRLLASLPSHSTVYDIGCGHKPYASLFDKHIYIGIDTDTTSSADVNYDDGAAIPLPDVSADLILCTQTLQHTQNPVQLMNEVYRLLKPGRQAIITVPFGIKMVAEPYPSRKAPQNNFSPEAIPTWRDDYWRFTKYGLLLLLVRFKVVSLSEATGYAGTLIQLRNYFLASLNIGLIAKPFYFINNLLGLAIDSAVKKVSQLTPRGRFFYETIYCSFTSNYIAIIKKS